MAITIYDFSISEDVADHMWRRHVTRDQLYEMLEHLWGSIPNRNGRAAKWVVIGRDNTGRCIAVPVAPTDDPTVWRPITAWYCKPSEAAKLR
jgi:hypothetical protein